MEGKQECKLVVLAAELSGLCGKILARYRPGQVCNWEAAIRDPPLPYTAGLPPLLLAWDMGTQHLARAFLIPTVGARSIYSAQLTLNKTLSRDILLSSPLPCTFLSPFYLLGRGRGEGTGKKRFTLSWGEGGLQ